MKYIIIPCLNEGPFIKNIINICDKSNTDKILFVDNGSTDKSIELLKTYPSEKLEYLSVNIPLGHDIPKALGLYYAILEGGSQFVFIDGDMIGVTTKDINTMLDSLEAGVDLALTDCYCDKILPSGLAAYVLEFRRILNTELNLFPKINYATPSHGPIGMSKNMVNNLPFEYIGIPPLLLLYAANSGYNVAIGLNKLHAGLGSSERTDKHRVKMAETIIGDTIFTLKKAKRIIPNRRYDGLEYIGFHEKKKI